MFSGVDFGGIFNMILGWYTDNFDSNFDLRALIDSVMEYFNMLFGPPPVID